METSPGEVKGVSSSSCCFPLLIILTRSTGDGEGDRVAYAEIGSSSSEDKEGGGSDEDGGEGGERSVPSRLWWTSPQSCCVMYSTMNARGMT